MDWTVESGWTEKTLGGGVRLRGDGPEDTVLMQEAEVIAETEYCLQVKAVHSPAASDADNLSTDARSRLELNWLQDGTQVGEVVVLPLDRRAFPTRAWRGTAPAGAKRAQLRLLQPQGEGQLEVEEIRLEKLDLIEVPLTFLGESPGQLKVRDLRVTYDLPEAQSRLRSATRAAAFAVNQVRVNTRGSSRISVKTR
jgi:hypothetical protein